MQVLPSGRGHGDVDDEFFVVAAATAHLDAAARVGEFSPNRTPATAAGTISRGLSLSSSRAM